MCAALHGDHYTPQTMWSTLRAGEAAARWTFDLFERVLAGDPQFGAYNELAVYFLAAALLLLAFEVGMRSTLWRQAT